MRNLEQEFTKVLRRYGATSTMRRLARAAQAEADRLRPGYFDPRVRRHLNNAVAAQVALLGAYEEANVKTIFARVCKQLR